MTLQLVVLGEGGVHEEVERAHGGHGPEEVVEVALVEVVGDPPWTTPRGRERRHDGIDGRAQVAAQRDGEQRQRRARALHGLWRLGVEALLQKRALHGLWRLGVEALLQKR